jgi:hypothetical protein
LYFYSNRKIGLELRLRGGAPPAKGGKGGKGGAKDTGAKAGAAKEVETARVEEAFPEERLEDQPEETGARHDFWVWCQNLKREYDDGTREIAPELIEKKTATAKSTTVLTSCFLNVHTVAHQENPRALQGSTSIIFSIF